MLNAPLLEHFIDVHATVSAPIDVDRLVGLGLQGRRRMIPITGGTVTGAVQGKILAGGNDIQHIPNDTTALLDARYFVELEGEYAGEFIYIVNRAIRRGSAEDVARIARSEPVDPSRIYFRCTPQFEVSSSRLSWLTETIFVGTGARAPGGVSLSFFKVL